MDNPGDLMHLCRLCLVKDQVNIPIFEEHGDIRQIFVKISSCLPVKVSKDDQLPKRICDGCSNKLDLLYEFCNTSANSEKKLLSWLEQAGLKDVDTISAVAQHTAKPLETQTQVKQEALEDIHAAVQQTDHLELTDEGVGAAVFEENAIDESDEPPPPKRARRTAAVKAQINITPDSDDDDDMDISEPMTKVEDESDDSDVDKDPSYVDVPGTSADDQPGPSGVGKDGVEAPLLYNEQLYLNFNMDNLPTNLSLMENFDCQKSENIPASTVVDQLNATDDLLNLLSTEEECTAILNNIATDEQFQRLIDNDQAFSMTNQNIESGEKSSGFKCDICKRVCTTKKLLKKHLMRHTEERKIPCKVCGKLFRFNYEVTAHARTHDKPSFKCDMCMKMFIHKSHLNAHRKRHLAEFVAFCDVCSKGFISEAECAGHKTAIHDNPGRVCEICGLKLSSISALKEHRSIHDPDHGQVRDHICDICGKSYMTKRNLKSHMVVHSRTKPYVCRICGKTVSSKNTLETHVKMHTGVKDFFCDVCDKSFASKEYLQVHQRTHTGHKPFQCHICPKKFTQKTSLTVHLRYHTGHKPYKCECGKNFTTKSHLMTHYKAHDVGGVEIDYLSYHLHDPIKPC